MWYDNFFDLNLVFVTKGMVGKGGLWLGSGFGIVLTFLIARVALVNRRAAIW